MSEILTRQYARRDELVQAASRLVDNAEIENRPLTDLEARQHAELLDALAKNTERVTEIERGNIREASAAAARPASIAGQPITSALGLQRGYVTSEPTTYRRGGEASYFADMHKAFTSRDREAVQRLERNDRENRAMGNSGQTSTIGAGGGAGGEFAPPSWLTDQYVKLARPGRPTADLLNAQPMPENRSSINLPKISTGTLTGVQSTQNTALASQDMATSSVSTSITTIGGKVVLSQQLIDQSGAGSSLDEVIMADLAADYARQVDQQVLSGTGASGQLAGILNVSGINVTSYTDAAPAVAGAGKLYATMAKAKQAVDVTRYSPITAWVMHPNRWGWFVASFDTQNRPLFLSEAYNPTNAAGVVDRVASQAVVGSLHGLPVIIDAQIPTNLGAGTNQDIIIGAKWDDIYLYETTPPRVEAFQATYADSLGILVRLYNYLGLIANRQPKSIVTISGTGLVSPSY